MISESNVCLDRRVASPPAVEAGGSTTWTLPYPVAVDGSQGQVVVVRLDTAEVLTTTRPSTTTVAAVGSFSALAVVAGISYTYRFIPGTIYNPGADGKPDRRANVQLSYVRARLSGTRSIDGTVKHPDRSDYTEQLRQTTPTQGQTLSLSVCADSKAVTLEFTSDSPFPVCIGALDWEGQFDPRSATQVP